MPAADGNLVFNTKIDTGGVRKGTGEIDKDFSETGRKIRAILNDTEKTAKSKAASIAAVYKKMGESQSEALKHAWETVKTQGEEFSGSVSDGFNKVSDSAKQTSQSVGDSIKEFGKNIVESRDWITMAVKVVVGAWKAEADAALDIVSGFENAVVESGKTIAKGIAVFSAEAGKFTLKQFIGDWENSGFKKIMLMAGSLFSAYKPIGFGKEGMELGSDLSEVQNVVDVTFSHMTDKVDEWSKKAVDAYGLSETMAKKFVGLYGSMSKAFGFSEKEAFEMSSALAGLAGDVASFYNIDQDLAYTKLKSVFSGETETLKDLGIVMTENALNDYAMRKGMGKTVSKMSEAEKVTLRYHFVMEQLNSAAGDFSRTQESWANQTRLLTLRWDTLKATMGRGFINALTPALKLVNRLIEGLQTIGDWFEHFTIAIFGNSTAATGAMTEGLETAADTADTLADSIGNVADKSDELRHGLANYDELNLLTDNADTKSAEEMVDDLVTASGVIDNLAESTKQNAEKTFSSIEFSAAVQEAIHRGNWRKVGFLIADKINDAIDNIPWDSIQLKAEEIATNVGDFINGAFESPDLWITLGKTIAEGINTAMLFLLDLLKTIDFHKIGLSFAAMLNEFLDTFRADKYGELAAERVNAIFEFIAGFAFDFHWETLGEKIGEALASYFQSLDLTKSGKSGKTIPETVAGLINGLIQAGISLLTYEFTGENGETQNLWAYIGTVLGEGFNSFLQNFSLSDAIQLIKSGIKSFVSMIYKAFNAIAGEDGTGFKKLGANLAAEVNNWLGDESWWKEIGQMLGVIINDILDFALSFAANIDSEKLGNALMNFLDGIDLSKIISKLLSLFSKLFFMPLAKLSGIVVGAIMALLGDPVTAFFSFIWADLLKGAVQAWVGIQQVFSHVGNWFKDTFSNAWEKVKEVFSSGGRVFEGIKAGIVTVFSSEVNHLIDGINVVIRNTFSGLNNALSNIRNFDFLGNKPFSFIQTIDVPQIPRLATGTVVPANYGEFLAVLGDNKREPEVVSPVSAMKQAFLEALAEIGYNGGGDRPVYVTVVMPDGSVLLRAVGEADDDFYSTHGFSRFDRRQKHGI